ncbi:MAG: RsmD family RNA methyltransferase, partial [Myxococcota bacterium]|nr:RsmD family RNA methyltransferase [Myxococcota bacterium]
MRRWTVPRGTAVRPTSSRVREAIFDILGQRCDGDAVLDLYAGAGTLGLEALLRGANSLVAV